MEPHRSPKRNWLLNALPAEVLTRLESHLELVELRPPDVVYEINKKMSHVYFPTDGIVSLLYTAGNGNAAEVAIVGFEGVVGVSIFMGGETTPSRALVQSPGFAYRLKAEFVQAEFARGGPLQHLLLRYTQAMITQMAQTVVCNRHHTIEKQLCRWLLLCLDRVPTSVISMTQDLIATMLGVRRVGVTKAAGRLEDLGLIACRRGRITVIDRAGLEAEVCECYKVVKTEIDRLLPKPPAAYQEISRQPG